MLDSCADDLGELAEQIGARSWELVTADESTVIAEPVPDAIVVEDGEGDGCFSNPPCTDESEGLKILSEINDFLDQFVASEAGPGRRGRYFSQENTVQTSDYVPS